MPWRVDVVMNKIEFGPFLHRPFLRTVFVLCPMLLAVLSACQATALNGVGASIQNPDASQPEEGSAASLGVAHASEVSLEISGSINVEAVGDSSVPSEIAFREKVFLSPNKTVLLMPLAEKRLKSELTEGKNPKKDAAAASFRIEVTPVQFYVDSVKLRLEIFARREDGRFVSVASPVIVAPFGESSELSELNTSSQAQYAGLRFSFFPQAASSLPLPK